MANKSESFIPAWDGDPATFIHYKRKALRYVETTKTEERYLCGPRLESRLTGKAEAAVERCKPGWVSKPNGVRRLLEFLEDKCAKQAVPDLGSKLTAFFFKLRRKKGEHMSSWCMRHQNEYEELRRALARVEGGTHDPKGKAPIKHEKEPDAQSGSKEESQDDVLQATEAEDERSEAGRSARSQKSRAWSSKGQWGSWGWRRGDYWRWAEDSDDPEDPEYAVLPAFLPDVILGWLLLQRSGLDSKGRSVVLAATHNKLNLSLIEEALKAQWPDEDVEKHDAKFKDRGAKGAFVNQGEDGTEAEEETAPMGDDHAPESQLHSSNVALDDDLSEEPTEEELQDFLAAREEENEALAMMATAQRTLKDSRQRQAQSKLSRNFYPAGAGPQAKVAPYRNRSQVVTHKGAESSGGRRPFSSPKCVKCGGKHWASRCPDKGDPSLKNGGAAHFAAMEFSMMAVKDDPDKGNGGGDPEADADDDGDSDRVTVTVDSRDQNIPGSSSMAAHMDESNGEGQCMFAEEAIREGKGVIDCGATHTIGSLEALDQLAQRNYEKHGDTRVDVDTSARPWYTFGDGERRQCTSRSTFAVRAGGAQGTCGINGLDVKGVPILLAVNTLQNLGAIVDFGSNICSFQKVAPDVIVKLEKAKTGHLYLSLVDDLLTHKTENPEDVATSVSYAKKILELSRGSAAGPQLPE